MRGNTEIFIVSCAEILCHDNTGTHGNAAKEANDQEQKTAGGSNRGKGTVTEQSADNQRICSII